LSREENTVAHPMSEPWVNWQPIDTGPKEGEHVLLAVTGDDPPGYGYVCEGYYESDRDAWYQSNTHWTDTFDGQVYPSHWAPLPAPPRT
jgi:hypothetical protein